LAILEQPFAPAAAPIENPMTEHRNEADLEAAIASFNRGEYFDAAERFEQTLAATDSELKELIGALNRIAAALHLRFERGGRQAAINLLSQAMLTLDDMRPARGGIDVERLYAEISALTEEIRATPRDEHDGIRHRARIFLERRRAPRIMPSR
jgi:tetratricopeptide (TPR) repeat protein